MLTCLLIRRPLAVNVLHITVVTVRECRLLMYLIKRTSYHSLIAMLHRAADIVQLTCVNCVVRRAFQEQVQLAVRKLDFLHRSILRHLCGLHTGMQGRPLPAREVSIHSERQYYVNMGWFSSGQSNTARIVLHNRFFPFASSGGEAQWLHNYTRVATCG